MLRGAVGAGEAVRQAWRKAGRGGGEMGRQWQQRQRALLRRQGKRQSGVTGERTQAVRYAERQAGRRVAAGSEMGVMKRQATRRRTGSMVAARCAAAGGNSSGRHAL